MDNNFDSNSCTPGLVTGRDVKSRDQVSSRDRLETRFLGLGLGLGLASRCLGLGLGLESSGLGLGLGLEGSGLGLDLGLESSGLGLVEIKTKTKTWYFSPKNIVQIS